MKEDNGSSKVFHVSLFIRSWRYLTTIIAEGPIEYHIRFDSYSRWYNMLMILMSFSTLSLSITHGMRVDREVQS